MSAEPLLKVQDLSVTFRNGDRETVAAQGVSYELAAGEVLAVVGESGSGKSVTALALTRLLPPAPGCVLGGSVRLQGVELLTLPENQLAKVRGGSIAYIFQEPGSSLNPVYTIGFQIGQVIQYIDRAGGQAKRSEHPQHGTQRVGLRPGMTEQQTGQHETILGPLIGPRQTQQGRQRAQELYSAEVFARRYLSALGIV